MAVNGPPTALSVNVTDANGAVTRWGSEDLDAADIPTNISFRTGRDGFGDASLTLARRIDRDYVDLNLLDDVTIVGADGTTAYEGRIGAAPRSFDGAHSISLQCAGWIAHTRDRQFTEIYVDRDLSQWHSASRARQVALIGGNFTQAADPQTFVDPTGTPGLLIQHAGVWASPIRPLAEAWYDVGEGNKIGRVYYSFANVGNASLVDANWALQYRLTDTDDASVIQQDSGDIWNGTMTAAMSAVTGGSRYAFISFFYTTAPGGAAAYQYSVHATELAVWGNHGLNLYGPADPYGVLASDVIRDIIGRFCPKLNTAGVLDTSFPIPHLVFRDLTHPYDALLEVNKYHLWDFAVWENKTLSFKPMDLTDYDWEIRLDDRDYPASVSLQGDSTQDLANGVAVTFQDVATGQTRVLLPTNHAELRDPDVENPFTKHGYQAWKPYQVSVPTTEAAALQLGRAALAEFNQPQAPGSITIGPHIRDRAGHPQPAWKVRAGDRVAITSSTSLSDRPRVISETSYDHGSRQVMMSLDGGVKRLDAVVDRMSVALAAAGLA